MVAGDGVESALTCRVWVLPGWGWGRGRRRGGVHHRPWRWQLAVMLYLFLAREEAAHVSAACGSLLSHGHAGEPHGERRLESGEEGEGARDGTQEEPWWHFKRAAKAPTRCTPQMVREALSGTRQLDRLRGQPRHSGSQLDANLRKSWKPSGTGAS